ncbi:MAG: translation elongation factor Ts [Mariprofundaceae bacterium]|nr:translation elongation factor Ts [Mariprofundaceae bacterium]
MAITAKDVKKLRDLSGAGMMDCKKALTQTDGDLNAAVDFLRKKGLGAAEKKSGRIAAEGVVLATAQGNTGLLLEVNAETDFVSKNDAFTKFVTDLAAFIIKEKPADIDILKTLSFSEGLNVAEALSQLIANIGENISIRRFQLVSVEAGSVGAYIHGAGKIGVLVGISGIESDEASSTARDIAMHVAAVNPDYTRDSDVPVPAVERERTVLSERAAASGKPEKIIARIVDGQLKKFFAESCLLNQDFVKDADRTVGQVVSALGEACDISDMVRFQLGEGIEKAENDFAAEVAAQVNG